MATGKEEENATRNAQALYVIRFQAPKWLETRRKISKYYFLSAARLKLR